MAFVNYSTYMDLPVPIPGIDPGPDWANNIVACLTQIDSHNHTGAPNGIQLTQAALNITGNLSFNGFSVVDLLTTSSTNQTAPLSTAAYPGAVYMSGNNLYFNYGTGSYAVQITAGSTVNATSSGIISGTASASFSGGVLVVDEAANTPANIQAGSYLLGNNTAGSDFITIATTTTISTPYTLGIPVAPPASTTIVQMNISGTLQVNPAADLTTTGQVVAGTGVYPGGTGNAELMSDLPTIVTVNSGTSNHPIVVSANPASSGLMVVRGVVAGNGTIISGEGFTVNNFSTGQYAITFSTNFLDEPAVAATGLGGGSPTASLTAQAYSLAISGVTVAMYVSGTLTNFSFSFIAIGQRLS